MERKSVIILHKRDLYETWGSLKECCTVHEFPYHSLKTKKFPFEHNGYHFVKTAFREKVSNPNPIFFNRIPTGLSNEMKLFTESILKNPNYRDIMECLITAFHDGVTHIAIEIQKSLNDGEDISEEFLQNIVEGYSSAKRDNMEIIES